MMVCSVAHTGTHLIAKMFPHWIGLKDTSERKSTYVGHISKGQIDHIMRLGLEMPVITPIRHPYLVQESWIKRGKGLSELITNYQMLIDKVDQLAPFYIAIDSPERDDHLDHINYYLDLNLKNDWSIKNSYHNTHSIKVESVKPTKEIEDFYERNVKFFKRFY